MHPRLPYAGEIFSVLTAFTWAWAVILFKKSGEKVHPLALGLFKNTLGMVLFFLTMLLWGQAHLPRTAWRDGLVLLLSGGLGIGVADTLFFACLNRLGAALAAIVSCLYSPFIIGLSAAVLGETLRPLQVLGAAMIVSAVIIGTCRQEACAIRGGRPLQGVIFGVVSMACTAVGVVMIKPILDRLPLLWVTQARLLGGEASLIALVALRPDRGAIWSSLYARGGKRYTLSSSVIGGYLAMLLWLAGMKHASASVASALNETSTIFIFILSALFLREPLTLRRALAVALGFGGAVLVTFAR